MTRATDQLESAQFQLERAEHLTHKAGSDDWPKADEVLTNMMAKEQAILTKKLDKRKLWLAERQPTLADWQNFPAYLKATFRGAQGTQSSSTEPKMIETQSQDQNGSNNTRKLKTKQNSSNVQPFMDFTIPRTVGRPGAPTREGREAPNPAKQGKGKPRNRSRSRKRKHATEESSSSATASNPTGGKKRQRNKEDVPPPKRRSRSRSRKPRNQGQPQNQREQNSSSAPHKQENTPRDAPTLDKKWQLISMPLDKI